MSLTTKGIEMSTPPPVSEGIEKSRAAPVATAFGCPRNFLDNRFVYTVVSARARGLSIGINMNPDRFCNFDCVYCEVNREIARHGTRTERRGDGGGIG